MKQTDAVPFAETVINNTSTMIHSLAGQSEDTSRCMDSEMASGVLVAQSNLAIAAALMVVAQAIGRNKTP